MLDTFTPTRPEWEVAGMEEEEEMNEKQLIEENKFENRIKYKCQNTIEECNYSNAYKSSPLNNIITCEKCGKLFKHKKSLKKHNIIHPDCVRFDQISSFKHLFKISDISKSIKSCGE